MTPHMDCSWIAELTMGAKLVSFTYPNERTNIPRNNLDVGSTEKAQFAENHPLHSDQQSDELKY